jgi:transposase, IS5 family
MNKSTYQSGFFDHDERLERLSSLKDPLVEIGSRINFEQFRGKLESATIKEDTSKGGRPAYDRVMLFKAMVLKKIYSLSDDQLEYQITDRLSFMRFLGLQFGERIPDAKTFWLFQETLADKGVISEAFDLFNAMLRDEGYFVNEGKIIDASIVKAPVQRNSREDNRKIKEGSRPENWSENKKRQKDTDADWTTKNGKNYFGYKNHIKIDQKSKLIEKSVVTMASIHDSQVLDMLITDTDKGLRLYADSAYESAEIRRRMKRRGIHCYINKKGKRNSELTDKQKAANKAKSRTRCRVEHVFASLKGVSDKMIVRTIGLIRAESNIVMHNIVYNMTRYCFLKRSAVG